MKMSMCQNGYFASVVHGPMLTGHMHQKELNTQELKWNEKYLVQYLACLFVYLSLLYS